MANYNNPDANDSKIFTVHLIEDQKIRMAELVKDGLIFSRSEFIRLAIFHLIENYRAGNPFVRDPCQDLTMKILTVNIKQYFFDIVDEIVDKGYFNSRSACFRSAVEQELLRWEKLFTPPAPPKEPIKPPKLFKHQVAIPNGDGTYEIRRLVSR